jgi:YaiO family outer membrane protein
MPADTPLRPFHVVWLLVLLLDGFMVSGVGAQMQAATLLPPPPSIRLQQAKDFESTQQWAEAIAAYRGYLTLRPEDDEVRAALARVLSWHGDYSEAVSLYRDIVSRHPVDLDSRTQLARVLSWQKRMADAQEMYEGVLREDPQHVEAMEGLADVFLWTGHPEAALPHYKAVFALTHAPEVEQRISSLQHDLAPAGDGDSPSLPAQRRGDVGQGAEASPSGQGDKHSMAQDRRILLDHPNDDEARAIFAHALAIDGQYDEAVSHYQTLLARHPADLDLRVGLARVWSWQKNFVEAEGLYRAVLREAPDHLDATRGLADTLWWNQRPREALSLYEALYRALPDPDIGQRIEAMKAELREAARSVIAQQILRAREQAWSRQYELAIHNYRAVLLEDPANVEAKQGLADVLYWSGRYQDALQLYEAVYAETNDAELPDRMQAVRAELLLSARAPVSRGAGLAIPFRDYLKVGYSHYAYTNKYPDERDALVEAAKPIGTMTLVGRVEPLNRFGLHDTPVSGELYSPLWSRAWGYLGGSGAVNAQFVPTWSAGGELFQGLGAVSSSLSFLEVSAGYKRMTFKSADIDLVTPGLTIYLPWNIWVTEKISYVPKQGSITAATQVTWRPRDRLQFFLSGAHGTSGERIIAVQDFQRVKTTIWQGGVIFPITERVSGEASGYYEDRGFLYVRRGGTFNLIWHW